MPGEWWLGPPYSTHITCPDEPGCIGRLDASEPEYFEALEAVYAEVDRILRERRYLAVYLGDAFKKERGPARKDGKRVR